MGVAIEVDPEAAPNGSRAIRVDFNGGSNPAIDSPSQYVPVHPNQAYHFHAYMRTEGITTESGMRFLVADPNHNGALNVLTDNLTGSHAWASVDADFTSAPATSFLLVRLFRDPSRLFENKLEGTVWIADISLVPFKRAGRADIAMKTDPRRTLPSVRIQRAGVGHCRGVVRIHFGNRSRGAVSSGGRSLPIEIPAQRSIGIL